MSAAFVFRSCSRCILPVSTSPAIPVAGEVPGPGGIAEERDRAAETGERNGMNEGPSPPAEWITERTIRKAGHPPRRVEKT
jgi:hypothetical protein